MKGEEGELFGLHNLFKLTKGKVVSLEIEAREEARAQEARLFLTAKCEAEVEKGTDDEMAILQELRDLAAGITTDQDHKRGGVRESCARVSVCPPLLSVLPPSLVGVSSFVSTPAPKTGMLARSHLVLHS